MPNSDNGTGTVQFLNTLLSAGMPQSYIRGSIQPGAGTTPIVDDKLQKKRLTAFASMLNKNGSMGMGGDRSQVGITLPKLLGDFRTGVQAPVLYQQNRMKF